MYIEHETGAVNSNSQFSRTMTNIATRHMYYMDYIDYMDYMEYMDSMRHMGDLG